MIVDRNTTDSTHAEQAVSRNFGNASHAEVAVLAYASHMESRRLTELGDSYHANDEWLLDLLTDLRHWAREHEVNFDDAVRVSEFHFQSELDEEGGAE